MRRHLNRSDLMSLSYQFELGLLSGRDLRQTLARIKDQSSNEALASFATRLLILAQNESWKVVWSDFKKQTEDPMEILLFDILTLSEAGTQSLSKALARYRRLLKSLLHLDREARGLLFLPKFQAIVGLMVAASVSILIPLVGSDFFPSFLKQGRWVEFFAGLSLALAGGWILMAMAKRSQRLMERSISRVVFLSMQVVFIRSGIDALSAWNRALELADLEISFYERLRISSEKPEQWLHRLFELIREVPIEWRELLEGLRVIMSSGVQVSDRLDDLAQLELEKIEFESFHRLRRTAALTILPVQMLIFPATLYLMLGPQLMDVL